MGQKADAIRNAVYGKDVRETMAQLAEDEEQLREDYNAQVINAGSSNAEIVDARGNFFKLKDRLDDTNSQLAGKANQSDITALNAKVGNMGNTKTFKGSCLFANLPTTGNAVDDYYYVTDKTTNYCWNGVAWIDIGNNVNVGDLSIINSKIALRSISPSKLSFTTVEGIQSKNLFNKNKVTIGYFVEFDNGLLYANSDYNVNTVEISPNTQYTLKHVDQSAFYDIEGKYISGFNSAGTNTFVSPDNAYFMKISTINANLNTQQLELGSSSTAYESGGNKFDGQYLKQMSVDWQQIKNPLAFILQNNSIIVNLQTKKISIPNYFYIITKQYAIDIPSQADIDFSALESNNIWICYYDISTGTIKITEFYNSLSLHVILFYMYNNNIYSLNPNGILLKDTSGNAVSLFYNPAQPVIFFDDKITVDYVNSKIIIPPGLAIGSGLFKMFSATTYSLTEMSFNFPSYALASTIVFDVNKAIQDIYPFIEYPSANYYGGNTDKFIVVCTIYHNHVTTIFPYKEITQATASWDETKDRLVLPNKMFFVEGKTIPLYKSSIYSNNYDVNNIKTALINIDANNVPRYQYFYEDISLNANDLQSTFTIGMKQNYNPDYNYYKNITKIAAPSTNGNGKTKNICCIGDSLTGSLNVPSQLKTKMLNDFGCILNLIGTFNNQEGRGGWSIENFIGKNNIGQDGVITISASGTTTVNQNPFLKLATDTDKSNYPQYCFRNTGVSNELSYQDDTNKTGNFYIFDYTNYLSAHGLANPDIVTIGLGTNDMWTDNVDLSYPRQALKFMIKQIKTALPNVTLGIIPQPASASNVEGNALWHDNYTRWIDMIIADVNTLKSNYNNLDIVPIWCHMNRDWNWVYDATTDLSDTSTIQKAHRAEFVHFNLVGQQEYLNAFSAYIMNVI